MLLHQETLAMKILIVDDSPTMRRIVSNNLREIGYTQVTEAEDGEDAMTKLAEDTYDLVITDWNMPNMDGLQLTLAIRRHERLHTLPVLMVTTRGLKQDVIAAMQAGVNGYVVKPFAADVLKEKISLILNYREHIAS